MFEVRQWSVLEPPTKPKHCIVGLAGRNTPSEPMMEVCGDMGFRDALSVGVRPSDYAWYPQPTSSFQQEKAVQGLEPARQQVEKTLGIIERGWEIEREDTVLLGFSAGAVMAIYTAMHSERPFKAIVSLAGAVLEPENIPECKHPNMPIILQHNWDDLCFDWEERYMPMRDGLKDKGYKVLTLERQKGGHGIQYRDIVVIAEHLAPSLGYEDWVHPGIKKLWKEREDEARWN